MGATADLPSAARKGKEMKKKSPTVAWPSFSPSWASGLLLLQWFF